MQTLGFLAAGFVLLAGFVVRERTAREPMLPLAIFRRRPFTLATLTYVALYAGLATALFYVSLFFQDVKGWSALADGCLVAGDERPVPRRLALRRAGAASASARSGSSPRARRSAASRWPASAC